MQKHVFFDLDSTLTQIEGLDHLAVKLGLAPRLAEITRRAMNGDLPMRLALQEKLEALRPTRTDLTVLAEVYLQHLTPGGQSALRTLETQGYLIWLVTGNFQPAAGLVAAHLGISPQRVLANRLLFNQAGKYQGFDATQPLANNGGKSLLIHRHTSPDDLSFMVGDGATDLETQGVVDLFIGFGGVARRERVKKDAQVYIEDHDLRAILPHILNYQKRKSNKNKLQ